jgi:hypothetical protein
MSSCNLSYQGKYACHDDIENENFVVLVSDEEIEQYTGKKKKYNIDQCKAIRTSGVPYNIKRRIKK